MPVAAARDQMSAKLRQDSARRSDGVERALRRMREEIRAAERGDDIGAECFVRNAADPQPNEAPEAC